MMGRLEHERRESGRAVLRAQEQERSRIAQDLHDEVNQALTGDPAAARGDDGRRAAAPASPSSPRPRRSPRRRWRSCCTSPASCARPRSTTTASSPALALADRRLRRAHGHPRALRAADGRRCPTLSDEEQLVIYRVTQESLSNVAQHAGASRVDVELNSRRAHGAARARRRHAASSDRNGRGRNRPRRLRHARAGAAGRRPSRRSSPRPARAPPSNSPWEPHEDPHRRRPRHRARRPEAADRPPAGHGGRRGGRGRRRRRSSARCSPGPTCA